VSADSTASEIDPAALRAAMTTEKVGGASRAVPPPSGARKARAGIGLFITRAESPDGMTNV